MICLDTNAIVVAIKRPVSSARVRINRALDDGVVVNVPSIVLFELWYGVAKSQRRQQNADALADFFAAPIRLLPFDSDDAREAGDIRAALERAGTPIGPYDILIAAQARRRGATLVTANEREFARVPGLKTEDWAA
ncbi:MAG: type II toxin-antitoxin system VapC family toxin [Pseudomonadota bacterium]